MKKSSQQTKAEKALKKWELLQKELDDKLNSEEKTIPLKVAHNKNKLNDNLADSA